MNSNNNFINIAIVDNQPLICAGLEFVLQKNSSFSVVHITNSIQTFVDVLMSNQIIPDILLIDLNIFNSNKDYLLELMNTNFPKIKIIILSNEITNKNSIKLIGSGIRGIINKSSQAFEIQNTIIEVQKFGKSFNKETVDLMLNYLQSSESKKKFFTSNNIGFTSNELSVLKLLLKQKSGKEIANILNLSKSTVENCRSTLLKKTNSKNTIGLVLYAINHYPIKTHDKVDQI